MGCLIESVPVGVLTLAQRRRGVHYLRCNGASLPARYRARGGGSLRWTGERLDRARAADRRRADPVLAQPPAPQPARAGPGRQRLHEAPQLRRDRTLPPEPPAAGSPGPASRPPDGRPQPPPARRGLRAAVPRRAVRRRGDAAAAGVAAAPARRPPAESRAGRRRALEPDRRQPARGAAV